MKKIEIENQEGLQGKPQIISQSYTRDSEITSINLNVQEYSGEDEERDSKTFFSSTFLSIVSSTHLTAEELVRIIFEHDLGEYLAGQSLADIAERFGITTYGGIVSLLIRAKYSADDVEAILLNNDDDEEHQREYDELQAWRKHAKEIAKQVIK